MSRDKRSLEEIEADIRRSRHHLDDTMHELEDRLSPRRMRAKARHYGRDNGVNEFFANLGQAIKQHPLPFLVTGIGLAWLFMSQRRAQYAAGHQPRDRAMAGRSAGLIPAREEAPQRMTATHLGTQQSMAHESQRRPDDIVGIATHLGTGQSGSGHVVSPA